jgi:hypothetical protein
MATGMLPSMRGEIKFQSYIDRINEMPDSN